MAGSKQNSAVTLGSGKVKKIAISFAMACFFVGCSSSKELPDLKQQVNVVVLSPELDGYVAQSISDWNKALGKNVFRIGRYYSCSRNTVLIEGKPNNDPFWRSRDEKAGAKDAVIGNEVQDDNECNYVRIRFGSIYYNGLTEAQGQPSYIATGTHEMGHFLGLKDSDDSTSIMYRYASSNTVPSEKDAKMVWDIHNE